MRKLLLFCFIALGAVKAFSMQIAFHASITDPTVLNPSNPKSPVEVPTVYIEDYVLTFMEDHPDYTLYIKDEDGFVVYSTTVWSSDTEVILPSTLSGDYEIELVMGNWLFTGWIEL